MAASTFKQLGWGNQPRVILHNSGDFTPPEQLPLDPLQHPHEALVQVGDALYRMAAIVDDQTGNPFLEAKVTLATLRKTASQLDALLTPESLARLDERQALQLKASGTVVLLSIAESQGKRTSKEAKALIKQVVGRYLSLLEAETHAMLAERMAINLDWLISSLPTDLAARAKAAMATQIPERPPYDAWFKDGNTILRIDWKCGGEFLGGWLRRLQDEKFVVKTDGGEHGESELVRLYEVGKHKTEVHLHIGPERGNVFRKMNDPAFHLVGYDGHSDWGRKIPKSLESAPPQSGDKVIMYLLCCGKQVLQRVRDTYPRTPLITTFNSSRFTVDFRYSEDFTAFIHVLNGLSRRENWAQIRDRVNKDWYNNPEANYLFPNEALLMARSLDRDHDGQADMFDKLIDFNTFNVESDARAEFQARVPETPVAQIVGTKLHFGVQVFHTLAHFNQVLEPFTHDLRVFSKGYFDPFQPADAGVITRGPTRVQIVRKGNSFQYFVAGSSHFAHATEEAWRALIILALTLPVMATEPTLKQSSPEERALTALMMVAHSLEVDDAWGRDNEVWKNLLPAVGLPDLPLSAFQTAKKADSHWYAGSKASYAALRKSLTADQLRMLTVWAA